MVDTLFNLIDLFISARALKDMSTWGTSDPICVVSEYNAKKKQWEHVAQTEVKKNDLNPDFSAVRMKFYFEKK
jgi:hypothetical protein